jgi:NAD(P)-dependent dehydrogenase (short-subunit alcohol dehydrogenase family)
LYYQSKFGNVVYATELARRYGDDGIVSTSLNPGNIATDLIRYLNPLAKLLAPLVLHNVSYGALTQLWAGTSAEAVTFKGEYLIPWARVGKPHPDTQDPETGKALWTWLEEQVEGI